MNKKNQEQVSKRMNYLIGHLAGVKKMIENDAYCIDVINQNLGVISALEKINQIILSGHFDSCVTKAIKGRNPRERQRVIKELLELYQKSNKY